MKLKTRTSTMAKGLNPYDAMKALCDGKICAAERIFAGEPMIIKQTEDGPRAYAIKPKFPLCVIRAAKVLIYEALQI